MSTFLQVLALALACLAYSSGIATDPIVEPAAVTCTTPFEALGDGCFLFVHHNRMSWQDARDHCKSLGGDTMTVDLATVSDCDQFSHIWQHILMGYSDHAHWMGATDMGQEGAWHWVTGEAVEMGLPYWYPGYPFNRPEFDCMAISRNYGYFTAENCTTAHAFACQEVL